MPDDEPRPDEGKETSTSPAPAGTMTELSPSQVEVENIVHQAQVEGSITAADLAEKL
jgi:hypothetical protein